MASADAVPASATIQNNGPKILTVDILLDARLGVFHYSVQAEDGNGAPDLDRLVFHFLDANGGVYTHRDTEAAGDGARGTWTGVAALGVDVVNGPFRAHLHVYDRHDAEASADVPVTVLSAPLDDVHEARKETRPAVPAASGRFALLSATDAALAPSESGWILLGAAGLIGIVAFALAVTRAPPQRRHGR